MGSYEVPQARRTLSNNIRLETDVEAKYLSFPINYILYKIVKELSYIIDL